MFVPLGALPPTMAPLHLISPAGESYLEQDLLQQKLNSHLLASQSAKREGHTLATSFLDTHFMAPPTFQRTEIYRHTHQRQHQHQHKHRHTFRSFTPAMLPPTTLPLKPGKWGSMHVTIAWKVYNHQQKVKHMSPESHELDCGLQQGQRPFPLRPVALRAPLQPRDLPCSSSLLLNAAADY
ncbi:autism susceptibility gene 2 protein-like [Sardina pilchardus]|uniref:autism susceptibility gene 2 protein-like n=1 Tax=Sardina pilchardus TaxID=27697 RepID=UPI002E11BB8E